MLNYADQKIKIVVGADTAKAQAKLKALQGKMKNMLKAGAIAGVAATAAAVAGSVKVFSDFEQSMANVKSVTFATNEEFEKLKSLALAPEVSALGYSAKEAGDALYYLGSAGYDAQQAGDALSGVLKLAAASQSDLALVSEKVAAAITMFGLEASDADMVADKFATTIANSQATMDKLSDSMTYAGPLFSQLGYNIDDMLAALGGLYNLGIPASQAGTALRQALSSLAKPTGDAAAVLEKYGLTVEDVNPDMNEFGDILYKLGEAGLSTSDMIDVLNLRGMSVGKMAEDSGQSFMEFKDKLEDSQGTAEEMANVQMDTLQGAFKILKNSVVNSGIAFGDWIVSTFNVSGRLKQLASGIGTFTESLRDAFDTGDFSDLGDMFGGILSSIPQKMVSLFSGIDWRGLSNGLSSVFSGVVDAFKEMLFNTDWEGFGTALFDAVAGVGEFLYNAIFNTDWGGVFEGMYHAVSGIGEGIKQRISETDWEGTWETLKTSMLSIRDGILSTLGSITQEDITNAVAEVFKAGFAAVGDVLELGSKLIEWVTSAVRHVRQYIASGQMVEDFRAWVQGIGDGISRAMQEDDIKQKVIDALKELFSNIGELTVEIAKLIIEFDKIVPQLSKDVLESEVGKALPQDIQATLNLPVHISAFAASFSSGDVGGMIEAGLQAIANLFGGVTPHAEGGVFTRPTMIGSHMFGEAGPEALIPLDRLGDYASVAGGNGGGDTITVENVNISMPVSQKLTRHEIDNMANYLEQRILQLGKRRKGIWFGG